VRAAACLPSCLADQAGTSEVNALPHKKRGQLPGLAKELSEVGPIRDRPDTLAGVM
jgi:hypothetical protein